MGSKMIRTILMGGNIKHIAVGLANLILGTLLGLLGFNSMLTDFYSSNVGAESLMLGNLSAGIPLSLLTFGFSAYYFTAKRYQQPAAFRVEFRIIWASIFVGFFSGIFMSLGFEFLIRGWDVGQFIQHWNSQRAGIFRTLNDIYVDPDTVNFYLMAAVFYITYTINAAISWHKQSG